MRIGLVTGEFPPMQGGVGAFSERLAQASAAQGHELHVITHRQARPQPQGRGLSRLARLGEPTEAAWGRLHPVGRRWGWRDVGQIAQLAIRYELDVLNIQYQAAAYNMRSPAINLAPWRLRGLAPTVVTFHDLRVPYLFPKAGPLRRVVVRLAAQKAHGVIVTNPADERTVLSWGIDETRVRRIPIGSNILKQAGIDEETVASARRELGVRDGAFLLGYFGFLNSSKGADLLVQALASLEQDVHLVFMGGRTGSSDPENNRRFVAFVEAMAQEMDLVERLHWTGFLGNRKLSVLFRAADLMVLPYRDGASLRRGTLMAALVHGCPILSTEPEHPVSTFRHGENMWLAARNDAGALADAIKRLRQDDALRTRLAEGARSLGREFSWEHIASRTVSFFETLIRN